MEGLPRELNALLDDPTLRGQAIRSLAATGLEVAGIQDVTPVPHNGVRPKKRRRV